MRSMQHIFKWVLILMLAGCGQVQNDETAIRNASKKFQDSYNQQDAKKLSEFWAADASYFNPVTGDSAEGRDAIQKLFEEKFAKGNKRHLETTIKSIEFPSENEAIENGVMKVNIDGQFAELAFQLSYIKENGKWLIKAINEIELQEGSTHYEELKELEWLIGKWEDTDDNVQISFDNQWDKHKNFINQRFDMKIYGQVISIEGTQIITWDPIKEIIRSWVFDSNGGFGEGTWGKVGKSWYAEMQYTLGDGARASSTSIYTPIDAQSYSFASVDREVDGDILPDMSPVTVVKIK